MTDTRTHDVDHRSATWVTWRIIRGLSAAAALVAALGGVPWALVRWTDWPIAGIPTWEQVSDFPTVLVTQDSTIAAILTLGVWAAWAVFALCVVVEVAGEVRGTSMRQLPAAGPLQRLARTLVASVAMTFGSLSSLTALAATGAVAPATAAPATAVVTVETPPVVDRPDRPQPPADTDQGVEWRIVTVEHGDTAWELAERHYGDGARWFRLWEDNKHRPQPDGRTWTKQSDSLEPSWQLRIRTTETDGATTPPSASSTLADLATRLPRAEPPTNPPAATAEAADAEVTALPGDNMWRLAEEHMSAALGRPATPSEVAPYWLRFVDANGDRFEDRSNPDLIYPGQTFVLPARAPQAVDPRPAADAGAATPRRSPQPTESPAPDPAPDSPSDGQVPSPPEAPATTSTTGQLPPTTTASPASAGEDRSQPATTTTRPTDGGSDRVASRSDEPGSSDTGARAPLLLGAGVTSVAIAVGITRAISRRRRRRNFHAPSTAPVSQGSGGDEDLYRQLLLDADTDLADALATALDSLAVQLGKAGHACRPRIVQHNTDHLDVLLDTATLPAVAGWQAQGEGEVWSVDPTRSALHHAEPDQVMAAPLLVTLGEPNDGGELYLDLEAAQVVSLAGDLEAARDLASTFVAELAHSPFTDNAQIIVVGDLGAERHVDLDRVTVVDDWPAVADNLTAWTEQSRQALAAHDWPNAFVGRGHDPDHDALVPLVVVAAEPPEDPDLLTLVQAGPTVTAVVTIGEAVADAVVGGISIALPGTMAIDCLPGLLSLPQFGLTCRPQVLRPDQVDAVAELLDLAEDTAGEERDEVVVTLDHPIASATPSGSNGASDAAEPYRDPSHEVLVRFLGEIGVEGSKHRLTAKQTSLVAFIALHGSVSVDRAADAVWVVPSAVSDRKRLSNLMTKCRGAVGGTQHLPLVEDDHYAIGPQVVTDLDLFERRIKAAATMAPAQAVDTLRGALELVRGPIFYYSDKERESFTWVDLGNWITHWELHVTTAACRATELYLDLGETRSAVEISDGIHRIVPTSPGLTEALMCSHAAAGNLHLVQGVFQAHVAALEKLGLETPAESTLALYEQLRAS